MPRTKISWYKGVATVVGEECMYVDALNTAEISFDTVIPYSRIGIPSAYGCLPYASIACGVLSGSESSTKKTIDKAYVDHLAAFRKKWEITGDAYYGWHMASQEGCEPTLGISLVPLGSLEGLSTVYSISPITFRDLFCSSVAYQISKRGAIYYHEHEKSDATPLGKIILAPQPTTPSDNPTKAVLNTYMKVIKELIKAPRKILLFEPPIERRGSPNYEAYAFQSAMKDFPEVFAGILSLGYVIMIEATESSMIDVTSWMKTNGQ